MLLVLSESLITAVLRLQSKTAIRQYRLTLAAKTVLIPARLFPATRPSASAPPACSRQSIGACEPCVHPITLTLPLEAEQCHDDATRCMTFRACKMEARHQTGLSIAGSGSYRQWQCDKDAITLPHLAAEQKAVPLIAQNTVLL